MERSTEPMTDDDEGFGQIFLKDFEMEQNEHFIKFVFIPYFKDIYVDLS